MQRCALVLDDVRMPGRLTPQQHQPTGAQPSAHAPDRGNGNEQQITLADQATSNGTITTTHLESSFSGLPEPDRVTSATVPLRPVGGGTNPHS